MFGCTPSTTCFKDHLLSLRDKTITYPRRDVTWYDVIVIEEVTSSHVFSIISHEIHHAAFESLHHVLADHLIPRTGRCEHRAVDKMLGAGCFAWSYFLLKMADSLREFTADDLPVECLVSFIKPYLLMFHKNIYRKVWWNMSAFVVF